MRKVSENSHVVRMYAGIYLYNMLRPLLESIRSGRFLLGERLAD
uniref:Transposase n=1 Tax=Heterorhabditis bacteriophora TaxID=37862 RepID=A0A1I7WQ17_HETBA